jgi:hypothetical protein
MKYKANGIVLARLDGGLGNQMFQYAAARAEAIRSGRELVLDPRPIAARRPDRRYGLAAFTTAGRLVSPSERLLSRAATGARVPGILRQAVQRVSGRSWHLARDPEAAAGEYCRPEGKNLILDGHWQSLRWFKDQEPAIRSDFRFKTELPATVASWAARIKSAASVAVHVRRGDYVSDPQVAAVHGTLPPSYYAEAAGTLGGLGIGPQFFIFSDDPDWAEAHLQLPGPASVVRCPAGVADHESLRLMMLCRHAIIANSTFSWWGAWLAEHPGQVVVAPRQWFGAREAPDSLFPPSWLVI